MGMRQTTPQGQIAAYIEKQVERYEKLLTMNLQYVGEQCVKAARDLPSPKFTGKKPHEVPPHQPHYIDWTGNLRSSIGYVTVRNGNVVSQGGFKSAKGGGEGAAEGKAYAEQLAAKFPHNIALVVVAGMNYAAYVSATGSDVLDTAELLAEKLVPQMMKQLSGKD